MSWKTPRTDWQSDSPEWLWIGRDLTKCSLMLPSGDTYHMMNVRWLMCFISGVESTLIEKCFATFIWLLIIPARTRSPIGSINFKHVADDRYDAVHLLALPYFSKRAFKNGSNSAITSSTPMKFPLSGCPKISLCPWTVVLPLPKSSPLQPLNQYSHTLSDSFLGSESTRLASAQRIT